MLIRITKSFIDLFWLKLLSVKSQCQTFKYGEKKPLSTQNIDFRRDLLRRTSQIRLKLALVANAPHSLCTFGSQIIQSDCMVIQSSASECCHSVWLCYMRGLSQPRAGRSKSSKSAWSTLIHILWIHNTANQQPGFSSLSCRAGTVVYQSNKDRLFLVELSYGSWFHPKSFALNSFTKLAKS